MPNRASSFGASRYARKRNEDRDIYQNADWRGNLRGDRHETRKEVFLRYSTPPARQSVGETRAFGDPPPIPRDHQVKNRAPREAVVSRLYTPRDIDVKRRQSAEELRRTDSPQRKREHNFKPAVWRADEVFSTPPKEVQTYQPRRDPRKQHIESKFNALRDIDAMRKEDARDRREATTTITKMREHHWCPAPLNSKSIDILEKDGPPQRDVRPRVYDWQVEQSERMSRERQRQQHEEKAEMERLAEETRRKERQGRRDRMRHRSSSASDPRQHPPPTHHYSSQGQGVAMRRNDSANSRRSVGYGQDDSQDEEIRRLQHENDGLRQYVFDMKAKEEALIRARRLQRDDVEVVAVEVPQQQQGSGNERRSPSHGRRGSASENPMHVLEVTWVPRRQIEEWRATLSRNAYENKVLEVSVRFLDGQKRYDAGIVRGTEGEDSLLVDNGITTDPVRLYNVSNTCFQEAEVSRALMDIVEEVPRSPSRSNVFAHKR